jgi:hypothetical protein
LGLTGAARGGWAQWVWEARVREELGQPLYGYCTSVVMMTMKECGWVDELKFAWELLWERCFILDRIPFFFLVSR